jgi:hypothetical protein
MIALGRQFSPRIQNSQVRNQTVREVRSGPIKRESALVVNYAFDVNVFFGLCEEQLSDISDLLRTHADRSQLARVRKEIDAILQDEMDLDRRVASRVVRKDTARLLTPNWMGDDVEAPDSRGRASGDRTGSPSGCLGKLVDQLQSMLVRVNAGRRSASSSAGVE